MSKLSDIVLKCSNYLILNLLVRLNVMFSYLFETKLFTHAIVIIFGLIISAQLLAQPLSELVDVKPSIALSKINNILEQNPNDEEGLFFRARTLNNLGKTDQAKEIYEVLIQRQPQSPEPYLNLAAIYSEKGDIKQAQKTLIQGINAHDGYSKLYKGLKSINGQLAAQAYSQALNKQVKEQKIDLEVAKDINIPKLILHANQEVEPAIRQIIKDWAIAWSTKNVSTVTGFYTESYIPENSGLSHKAWLQEQQLKISNSKTFFSVDNLTQRSRNNGEIIEVIFSQTYRSNTTVNVVKKQLNFVKEAGVWKISAEHVVG